MVFKILPTLNSLTVKRNTDILLFNSLLSSVFYQGNAVRISGSAEGRCYRHRCSGLNRYQIQVSGSEWVDCPAGGAVQVI